MLLNLRYDHQGWVLCDMDHPVYGMIPYTASPEDNEPTGKALWAKIQAGDYGPIAPYNPNEDPRVKAQEKMDALLNNTSELK